MCEPEILSEMLLSDLAAAKFRVDKNVRNACMRIAKLFTTVVPSRTASKSSCRLARTSYLVAHIGDDKNLVYIGEDGSVRVSNRVSTPEFKAAARMQGILICIE